MVFILNFNLENNNGCLPHLFIPKSILNFERFFFAFQVKFHQRKKSWYL